MKKLLIVNAARNYGSTGKIAEQIGTLALSNGWDVRIFHGKRYNRPSSLKSIQFGSRLSEMWHFFLSFLFDKHGYGSYFSTRLAIREIERYNPDIIHLHNIHGYFLNLKAFFKYISQKNIPIIWTLHDCWPFTGHCSYFDLVGCSKWKTGCEHCNNLSNYPKSVIDRSKRNFSKKNAYFTSLKNLTLVPVSDWLNGVVSQSFLRIFPSLTIHNGIDTEIFRIKKQDLKTDLGLEGKFVILGVSSNGFKGRKGLSDFVKLASLLSEDYKIILIGLTSEELNEVPSNMIGLRRTSDVESLVDYYNMADVFVNPTYSDNFPTTNVEALSCGTPVITYNTGGSPEAIDTDTGRVVPIGDIQALKSEIEKIRYDHISPELCRNRVLSFFDKDKCFKKYIDLYNSLLEERQASF